jgi:hypothetical protein
MSISLLHERASEIEVSNISIHTIYHEKSNNNRLSICSKNNDFIQIHSIYT